MRNLPDRVWKLPRHEDDEVAEEGIGRILALSDGVFAIAITLLILEIAIPATTSDAGLPKALLELWPRYLAYVLSFAVIARFWVTHHLAFRLIGRYDAGLVWLNLVLLMLVAFLPFPTAVLGEHNGSPAAAVLYAAAVIQVLTRHSTKGKRLPGAGSVAGFRSRTSSNAASRWCLAGCAL